MTTPLRRTLSLLVGWLADRKIPGFARGFVYRTYARITGADLSEVRMPLEHFPSLQAFFIRRLKEGVRPIDASPGALVSPVDGAILNVCTIDEGRILQVKGVEYTVAELLGDPDANAKWEGAECWTVYLSPRDYHRIHAPEACALTGVRWLDGARFSVQPSRIRRRKVLCVNERVVLDLDTEQGPLCLVLVGALNVGRMRVVGVAPYGEPASPPPTFDRGAELARFEMGSTIVLLAPKGTYTRVSGLDPDVPVKLGEVLGRLEEHA